MAVANLNSVADYLLCFAQEHGDLITPLKLQKMVFYADAWYMALNDGEQLIDEHFEGLGAWTCISFFCIVVLLIISGVQLPKRFLVRKIYLSLSKNT